MTAPYSEQARQNFLFTYYSLEFVPQSIVEAQFPQSLVPRSAEWQQALNKHFEAIEEALRLTLQQTNPQERQLLLNNMLQRLEQSDQGQTIGLSSETLRDVYLPFVENYATRFRQAHSEGQQYFEAYLSTQGDFFRPAQTYEESAAQNYVAERFPASKPHGIGVRMGEYAVVRRNDLDAPDFIATDYLFDCQALVLTGQADGQPRITVVAHIDAITNPSMAVTELLTNFPAGYRIEAGIFSSSRSLDSATNGMMVNPYLAIDLMQTLRQSGRIDHMAHQLNNSTTVAVDTRTGRILTANTPEDRQTGYRIDDELPITVSFASNVEGYERHHRAQQSDRLLLWNQLSIISESQSFLPSGQLVRAFSSHEPPLEEPSLRRDLERAGEDGAITHDELSLAVRRIGTVLSREGLCYRLEEQGGDLTIEIRNSSRDIASHNLPREISPHAGTGSCPIL
ncbi:MAG: hypothetical protein K2Q12_04000 [Rickettsiales bacterium]|nr:hypothetical protein [Rickettsiales bacterium]